MSKFTIGFIVSVFILERVIGGLFRKGHGYWRGWHGALVAVIVWALAAWMMGTHWGGSGPVWLDWPWRW
jgi:hypothetical protein